MQTPPALNQMATPDGDHSELCGETCVASVLQAFGQNVTVEQVTTFIRNKYGEAGVSGGTNANELMDALANWNVAARIVNQPAAASNMGSNYAICAIWSDAGGNPDPSHFTGHWILGYSPELYMNPYGGRYVTYPNLTGEDQDLAIIVANKPTPPGDDMTPAQLLNVKRSMIWPIRLRHENWPADQASVDAYANLITDQFDNYESVITALEQAFEQNNQPSENELLAAVQAKLAAIAKAAGA